MILIFIVYVACVIFPPLFWVLILRRLDADEPEPIKLLCLAFSMGIGAAFLAGWGNEFVSFLVAGSQTAATPLEQFFASSDGFTLIEVFMAGPIEESIKLFLLFEVIYHRPEFNQARDGVIYFVVCALGFSFLENTFYFFDAVVTGPQEAFLVVGVIRAIASTLIHVAAATIGGWFLSKAKFSGNRFGYIFLGLALGALLHGASNVILTVMPAYGILIELALTLFIFVYIMRKLKQAELVSA